MYFLRKSNTWRIIISAFLILFIFLPLVTYAATDSNLYFCEYPGVRRTFMILGLLINIVKIVIPLIIIITGIITLSKTIISGKADDLKVSINVLIKKAVAGVIIFLLPSAINYLFNTLIANDTSKFTLCTTCLFDAEHCKIPEKDPTTYIED